MAAEFKDKKFRRDLHKNMLKLSKTFKIKICTGIIDVFMSKLNWQTEQIKSLIITRYHLHFIRGLMSVKKNSIVPHDPSLKMSTMGKQSADLKKIK